MMNLHQDGGVIYISEVIDISCCNLESSLCFLQTSISMMYSAYRLNKQGDNIQPWRTPFPIWNQSVVPCPVLTCFLTCIQISQEAGQVVWYSHLQNFPWFIVIHTVKGFGIVNKAEIDVFLELSCFFNDPADVGNWGNSGNSGWLYFSGLQNHCRWWLQTLN